METYIENISNNSIRKQDYKLAESYQIDTLSPQDFNDITGGVVAIIAETGSGKTVFLRDILSKIHERYNKIYLMSRTAKLQKAYDFFPRSMITDDYDEELMKNIWENQIKMHEEKKPLENILVILDDIIASPSYKKSKMLEECAVSARQINITVIILSQYFCSIRPIIRENIRIAVAFSMSNKKEREKFINQFLSSDTYGSGEILFKKITGEKYQAIIVQKYKCGECISKKVKKYIADPGVKIKLKDPDEELMKKREKAEELVRPRLVKTKVKLVRSDKWGI